MSKEPESAELKKFRELEASSLKGEEFDRAVERLLVGVFASGTLSDYPILSPQQTLDEIHEWAGSYTADELIPVTVFPQRLFYSE